MITAEVVVLGAGTAGCVAAAEAARAGLDVVLVEAGPDFGARHGGGWPPELLEPWTRPEGHGWSLAESRPDGGIRRLERGRLVGGSSAVNGCAAGWGAAADYAGWAAAGLPEWTAATMRRELAEVTRRFRVRTTGPEQTAPFQHACLRAALEHGFGLLPDVNDLDRDTGAGTVPGTVSGGERVNAAFAFLDEVRERGLRVLDHHLIDRMELRRNRVHAVHLLAPSGTETVVADLVVLAAGTFGSPSVLARSGAGAPDMLGAAGIRTVLPLPGVGANLHDHPTVDVRFAGTPELERDTAAYSMAAQPVLVKARSSRARTAFDLHLFPAGDGPANWTLSAACLTPRSRGAVRVVSVDPTSMPVIRHGFLTDPEGHDRAVLTEGIELVRAPAAEPALRGLLGPEVSPDLRDADLAAWIDRAHGHYRHSVGTCRMGPDGDDLAVTDQHGRVRGLDNCVVLDASVLPSIPRANTNLPVAAVAQRLIRLALAGVRTG